MTTSTARSESTSRRNAITAMRVGLGLTVLAMLYLLLDQIVLHNLSDHLRDLYTGHTPEGQDPGDTTFVAGVLYTIGVLGIVSWLLVIRATRNGKSWVRTGGLVLFLLGLVTACATFVVGEYGTAIVPTPLAVAFALPCVAGLAAVVNLFKRDNA